VHDASPHATPTPGTTRRVLVTGADGLIGRAATEHLTRHGWRVTALSRSWQRPVEAERVLTGDVTDQQVVAEAVTGMDAVVHLAAIPHPSIDTAPSSPTTPSAPSPCSARPAGPGCAGS
jgi:nucleoside-diphosphate-sugar epimerase